jgi:hypothetical protein
MKLSILEGNDKMAEFNVEHDRNMFIVTPIIYNEKFDELSREIRLIRVKYMTRFLAFMDYRETDDYFQEVEHEIIEEIRSYVIRELGYYNLCEGCSYYIRIGN